MPGWGMHLYIAKKLNEKLKLDYNEFMIGNVLPDIYSGWIIKDASKKLEYEVTHYGKITKINSHKFMLPDYNVFLKEHKDINNNPLALGYLCHLLSDKFFNEYAFELKYIKDDKENVIYIRDKNYLIIKADDKTARKMKQSDFSLYSNNIINTSHFKSVSITHEVINHCKIFKNIDIESEDLYKLEKYLNLMFKDKKKEKIKEEMYQMFSKKEIKNLIDMCVSYILVIISENSLI